MVRFSLFAFLLVYVSILAAQNSPDFFKTIPVIDESTPDWARLMYSDNPNVAEVEDLFKAYHKTNEFVKTIHTQNHKHWIRIVEPLLDDEGFIKQPERSAEDALFKAWKDEFEERATSRGSNEGWVAIGPFETFKKHTDQAISWHKNIYAIDQSATNPDLLICGTEAGGVYKTTDKGANWQMISKGEVCSGGNSAVKIHPLDENNYLLASNRRIYQSLDGGQSWLDRHYTDGTGNEFRYKPDNPNIIFHTSTTGLFKSIDGGLNWQQVFTDACWDIDFHPTDANVACRLPLFRTL